MGLLFGVGLADFCVGVLFCVSSVVRVSFCMCMRAIDVFVMVLFGVVVFLFFVVWGVWVGSLAMSELFDCGLDIRTHGNGRRIEG